MKKKVKRFEIRYEGNVLYLSTDGTKFGTLETLLRLIFNEYSKKKPEQLDMFMSRLNLRYDIIRNRVQPQEEIEPLNDFDFWKELMERNPHDRG
ncbi:hypothetical protein [Paenibacillus lutimineralis]|uniref:Uncharacterized protein n=1 Tax=Paenibacillus lutimineralis TaxID=2707005 RepID=A0A3S9UWG7_9BACL|nr:hypothetical protein [Paenibacillus lutimineralis]AZS14571.1 hypothetical protein EI981_08980 [Paenibacillus lutimineralis]